MSLCDVALTVLAYFVVVSRLVQSRGLHELGLWSLVMGYMAFLRMLDQGGAQSVTRCVAQLEEGSKERVTVIDTAAIFSFMLFNAVSLIGYLPIAYLVEKSVEIEFISTSRELLLGLFIVLPLNMLALGQMAALDGIGRTDLRAVTSVIGTFAYALLAVVLIPRFGVLALVLGQGVQWVLTILLARFTLSRYVKNLHIFPRRFSTDQQIRLLNFSFKLQMASIPITLFDALNRILIGRFAGLDRLGIYDLAYKLSLSTRLLVQASIHPILAEFTRLQIADVTAARAKFMATSRLTLFTASIASVLQIALLPIASYALLGKFNPLFVLIAATLSLGWGLANIGLPLQYYARAAGILKWAHLGQWTLLALGVSLVLIAREVAGPVAVLVMPAIAIAIGNLLMTAGEARQFGFNPITTKHGAKALLSLVAFLTTAFAMIVGVGTILQ